MCLVPLQTGYSYELMKKKLAILRNDPWLEPFAPAIEGRHEDVVNKLEELTAASGGSISDLQMPISIMACTGFLKVVGFSGNTPPMPLRFGL